MNAFSRSVRSCDCAARLADWPKQGLPPIRLVSSQVFTTLCFVAGIVIPPSAVFGQGWDTARGTEYESAVISDGGIPAMHVPTPADTEGFASVDGTWAGDPEVASGYPTAVFSGTCEHCGQAGGCRCPKWTGQVDALFLWMGNIPSRTLFIDQKTRQPVFNANEAQTEVAVAPLYAILYHPDPCRAIEVNYFQVQSFPGDAALATTTGQYEIYDIAGIPPFEPINGATLTTSAQIKSFETNIRFSEGGPLRWLAGFRWVQWNQTMRIDDTFTDGLGQPGSDTILVDTGNNLYCAQLGCDAMLWNRSEGFQVNGLAKAGVFGNTQAFQRTSVASTTPGVDGNVASVADQTAFFGEVGVNASMALTKWLWWRAGYSLFWLSGVATPADQLGLTDIGSLTTSIDTEGSVLLHGVTTGLEARW